MDALITKQTVEIEVCTICNDRLSHPQDKKWHYFTCLRCLQVFCKHVGVRYDVEVQQHTPRGWPLSEESPRIAGRQAVGTKNCDEYGFRATACGSCAERIEQVLLAAGLTKSPITKSRYEAITLD